MERLNEMTQDEQIVLRALANGCDFDTSSFEFASAVIRRALRQSGQWTLDIEESFEDFDGDLHPAILKLDEALVNLVLLPQMTGPLVIGQGNYGIIGMPETRADPRFRKCMLSSAGWQFLRANTLLGSQWKGGKGTELNGM
ncbi:MAG: hypothetical protein P0121_16880 [Nitrospira sp.]|nr:hypothetical protein [Nitrospira sp.]